MMQQQERENTYYPLMTEKLFSSPHQHNYAKKHSTLSLNMPTWSWEEIELAAMHLNFPIDVASQNFDYYGGIPQFVFGKKDGFRKKHLMCF